VGWGGAGYPARQSRPPIRQRAWALLVAVKLPSHPNLCCYDSSALAYELRWRSHALAYVSATCVSITGSIAIRSNAMLLHCTGPTNTYIAWQSRRSCCGALCAASHSPSVSIAPP
jgi:hypothetical protein